MAMVNMFKRYKYFNSIITIIVTNVWNKSILERYKKEKNIRRTETGKF